MYDFAEPKVLKRANRELLGTTAANKLVMATPESKTTQANPFALEKVRISCEVDAAILAARTRAETLRAELEEAEREMANQTKARRGQARDEDRRALLVGRVLLRRALDKPETWTAIWPWIDKHLQDGNDADRALFGLSPTPRIDSAVASVSVAPASKSRKNEAQSSSETDTEGASEQPTDLPNATA